MNTQDMIRETRELTPDIMGRYKGTFNTDAGEVVCFIHRHGSRTSGSNWERIDFYLNDTKIKQEELD